MSYQPLVSIPCAEWGTTAWEAHDGESFPESEQFGWGAQTDWCTLVVLHDVMVYRDLNGARRYRIILRDSTGSGGVAASDDYYAPHKFVVSNASASLDVDHEDGPISVELYKPETPDLYIKEPTLMVNHLWHWNHAHMLFETLPRLRHHNYDDYKIAWDADRNGQEIATSMGIADRLIQCGRVTYFDTLCVPSFWFGKSAAAWTRMVLGSATAMGTHRLYVSRRDAKERRVVNEHEVIDTLMHYGFQLIPPLTGKSIAEQRDIFGEASVVVMPHGAACANMVFAAPQAALVEFLPQSYQHPLYSVLSGWNDQRYQSIVCPETNNKDMTVSIPDLKAALARTI